MVYTERASVIAVPCSPQRQHLPKLAQLALVVSDEGTGKRDDAR